MRVVTQKKIIRVIQPEVVEYRCDWCGKQCGTRANPKETWYKSGERKATARHYCKWRGCVQAAHAGVRTIP